jgi:hypothetical protein
MRDMLPRDRVLAALAFSKPDGVPVEYHPSPAGAHEHGERLRELWRQYPGDFGDSAEFPLARPDPSCVDAEGRYCEFRRDEWGVVWKHVIFGVAGHPHERPLDDWANLPRLSPPQLPDSAGPAFDCERERARAHQRTYFLKSGWISIFEVMHALRRFEDVLMDIESDAEEANRLADTIAEHQARTIEYLLRRGVDAIQFGDDFGTQTAPILSPKTWQRFFKPRYRRLMEPIHRAGARVFFHTCGQSHWFLDDLAELGVHAIWPQLTVYGHAELARRCRSLRLAIALHPDRGDLMVRGAPADVRRAVAGLAETFAVADGGAWFYIEIDSGFPFENVRALIESVGRLRAR